MASTSGLATPAYRITMEEYIRRSRKRRISETDGLGMHTVILDLMRHRQELWKRRSVAEVEDWQKLGVEVYERTGKIVSVNTMKSVFEDTKKTLRDMLIDIIQGLKADRILLRALLNNWPLYRHFDYYHAEILDFELHLYEELEEEEEELDEEEEEEEEEDDEERKDLVEQIVKTRYETANMRPCFTCTECSNAFDFEQDPPLVLPCGHPFCEGCFEKMDESVKCNSCEKSC
uniref:RING-type domain-containing protein n=1 Tax=Caenorhabditis tropicalis TaxID=1561998 RepID=A0A1I7UDR6_9PELO